LIIPKPVAPFSCDVLVYDTLGSSWLHHCIPEQATQQVLDVRHQRPLFLTQSFFFRLMQNYIHYSGVYPYRRYLSYVSTLFDHIRPRVVLTFADNNVVLGHYAMRNPSALVVSIQNAIRGTVGSIPPNTLLPVYFSLGNAERKVFNKINITHMEYIPVGSVKLGLFLEQHYKPEQRWDLSFCSHYRPELVAKGASRLFQLIENAQRHLFRLTCQYARNSNLSVAVLSKTRERNLQRLEHEYFRNLSGGYPFSFILGDKLEDEFATYQGAFSSNLIINLCSTLGYEAFGAGRKVLFGSGYRKDLLYNWGAEYYYDELPSFICLQNDSFSEFRLKAERLLHMDTSTYKKNTQQAAEYYLAMPNDAYPHEIIRQRLTEQLGY
jgi:surface carbohydrate biosynthesis protein